jgi:hypothetical protein
VAYLHLGLPRPRPAELPITGDLFAGRGE